MSVDWAWEPLSPRDVAELFANAPAGWSIAGGWALDLFLGRDLRQHADIDVQVPRAWLGGLHALLPGWQLYAADGTLSLWNQGEPFPESTTDIWCRREGEIWELQLMLGNQTDQEWVFKRDRRIRGSLDTLIVISVDGLPIIAPEIQLLYKSKLPNRPKDEDDFRAVLPTLDAERRAWLTANLRLLYGSHPWLDALAAGG